MVITKRAKLKDLGDPRSTDEQSLVNGQRIWQVQMVAVQHPGIQLAAN
jgi:hypothetical protein